MSGDRRSFPIIGENVSVPWEIVEPIRSFALRCHGQTLERLAERGGLSRTELGLELVGIDPFDVRRREGRTPPKDGRGSPLPVACLADHREKDNPSEGGRQ